ncbi:MAG: glycoside hydrolase, partial [Gammaproteobacteria bacterium]|nr:glycoside hydrolase [Gammaproteobacteria bacterium]
ILLEQIADYAAQVQDFLSHGTPLRDPLLAALGETLPVEEEERRILIKACLRANPQRLIDRFPAYRRLADIAGWLDTRPDALFYLNSYYLTDLVTWYHLAWLGETVRRQDRRVQRLLRHGEAFTLHERRELLEIIGELLSGVIGRYKALAGRGQVELSVTPYAHPILPLMLDLGCAREAMPEVQLPALERYPGGEERARWHIHAGIETFARHFGFKPAGCWPAEGGVSAPALRLLQEAGFRWTASGESVLHHSLERTKEKKDDAPAPVDKCRYRPYRLIGQRIVCFFRDDGLSDLVGFTYSDWHADDAVANLVHHLENIADACGDQPGSVVSIILDGENAWEYYPENGYYFLSALYRRLAQHPRLDLTTFSDCLRGQSALELPNLVAGSWVYGTFSTWIGDPDKNRAWDMLGEAKRAFDAAVSAGRLSGASLQAAERQLAMCEGSDWCWWFGDYNPESTVSDFERLYRLHLSAFYRLLGTEPPQYLSQVFAHGRGAPQLGGVMRRGSEG